MTERCSICGNAAGNRVHVAREMMFGLRDQFRYLQCNECGCLQLLDAVDALSRYYPSDYYSLRPPAGGGLRARLKAKWLRHGLGERNPAGALASLVLGESQLVDWVRRTGIGLHDRILDVGSGAGHLLWDFRSAGFADLTGIDPYIAEETHRGGLRVLKTSLEELEGRWDLVMLHHSFEHLREPLQVLRRIRNLLSPSGRVLIRTPVADSWAWRTYGIDWVQLDPPRHLFVHTRASLDLLAGAAGLSIYDLVHDSTIMQFWGSEQYRRDIPYYDPRSYKVDPRRSIFSRRSVAAFKAAARRLNARGEGDQICLYLRLADELPEVPQP